MQEADISEDYPLPAGIILHNMYRIERVLGRGGFAIIYKCVNLSNGDTIAIKEYFPSGLAKRSRQQGFFCVQPFEKNITEFQTGHRHFLEEAHILKECRNLPEIVTVYDFFKENQTAYIVMEYIEGLTLEQYIQTNGVLSISEMLELILPLLHSLKKVHEKGLIHRDISPNNMILGIDNKLHLIDFGAAKIKPAHPNQQQTIILKKGYAPPEQYIATGNIGAWSDIYALCATIYYALSGQIPVPAIDRLQHNTSRELSNFGNVPMQFVAVIERGLALQPSNRYKTLEEFIYALEHPESIENGNTMIEVPSTDTKTLHPRSVKVFITLFVAVLAIGGFLYAFRDPSARKVDTTSPAQTTIAENTNTSTPTPAVSSLTPSPVSTVPAILTMNNVTGLSQKKAKKKIHALDPSIKIQIKKKYDASQAKGHVISQSVTKGTVFNAGSLATITLTISRGAKPVVASNTAKPSPARPAATKKPSAKSKKASDRKPKTNSFEID